MPQQQKRSLHSGAANAELDELCTYSPAPLFTTPFTTFAGETARICTRIFQISGREASGKQGENLGISTRSRSFDR